MKRKYTRRSPTLASLAKQVQALTTAVHKLTADDAARCGFDATNKPNFAADAEARLGNALVHQLRSWAENRERFFARADQLDNSSRLLRDAADYIEGTL